ncbi:MAG: tRNA (adenosine(37)-N6)-threonylcarbamoyltransferase complex dimerization subunit type 1 TsaB [Deltaproteobacteria bacterium]|nr:tRNA (adenosine(37)-N6)-threonylcarbamoyltransferase complex dimerization subunit type 1 TsaB [Deltaproteobacteria bacterium]
MPILIFDTSTVVATAAVGEGARTLGEAAREVTTHSEGLIALIDEVLVQAGISLKDVDAIACGRGPGSYTGLRIGLATAKGLCLATQKPLMVFSSLLLPALAAKDEAGEGREVLALLDARRGEVFGCRYSRGAAAGEEFVCRPESIAAWVDPRASMVLVGDGAEGHAEVLAEQLPASTLAKSSSHTSRASHAAESLAERFKLGDIANLAAAVPVYLRTPDIRKPKVPASALTPTASSPAKDASREGLPSALPAQLLKEMRRSGLRLDREGRWWHEGELVRHQRLAQALHRWIDQLEDGEFIVRLDEERYATIEVEDTPFLVRRLRVQGEGGARRIFVELSDQSIEELTYDSLRTGEHEALYCKVKGRFSARLTRPAHFILGELLEEHGERFVLAATQQRFFLS